MLPQSLCAPALGLFSICLAVAAVELCVGDAREAISFRSLCALALSVCALRLALSLVE